MNFIILENDLSLLDIIKLSEDGMRNIVIARMFGVSESTVSQIVLNKDKYKLPSPKKKLFKKKPELTEGRMPS